MSYIDRLSLLGIRSFAPIQQDGQALQFFRPLTIIVGQNGSGKTTIIEALKYAVTGELPPSTSHGSGFIFDPNLIKESLVKAQVKLRFYNLRDEPMLVVRNMQVTQKPKKLEFKMLDAAIVTKNPQTGKPTSISSRCTDVDRQVPECLGVSKAILEHVVFCHQEESDWPLQADKIVKMRFDEIFASTKYTKAMEQIVVKRKELDAQIKAMQSDERVLQERMLHFEEINKNKHELSIRATMLQKECEESALKINQIEQARQQNDLIVAQRQSLEDRKRELETRATLLNQQKIESYNKLESELIESVEEIEAYQLNLKQAFEEIEAEVKELDKEKKTTNAEIHRITTQRDSLYQSHMQTIVQLQSVQKSFTQLCSVGTDILSQFPSFHIGDIPTEENVPNNPNQNDAIAFVSLLQMMEGRLSEMRTELKQIESEEQIKKKEAEESHNKVQMERRQNDMTGKMKREEKKRLETEVDSLRIAHNRRLTEEKVDSNNADISITDLLELKINSLKEDILKSEAELEQLRESLQTLIVEDEDNQQVLNEARKTVREIQEGWQKRAQVNVRLTDLNKQNEDLARFMEECSQSPSTGGHGGLTALFGGEKLPGLSVSDEEKMNVMNLIRNVTQPQSANNPPIHVGNKKLTEDEERTLKELNDAIKMIETTANQRMSQLRVKINSSNSSIGSLNTKIKMEENNQQTIEKRLVTLNANPNVKSTEEINMSIQSTEQSIERAKDDRREAVLSAQFYSKFLSSAKEKCLCPLCMRGFTEEELDVFVKMAELKISDAPKVETTLQKVVEEEEKNLKDMKTIAVLCEEKTKISSQLPNIYQTLSALQNERTSLNDQINECNAEIAQQQHVLELTTRAKTEIRMLRTKLEERGRLIHDISAEWATMGVENKGEEDETAKVKALEEDIEERELRRQTLSGEISQITNSINTLNLNVIDLKNTVKRTEDRKEEAKRNERLLEQKTRAIQGVEDELHLAEVLAPTLIEKERQSSEQLKIVQRDGEERREKGRREIDHLRQKKEELERGLAQFNQQVDKTNKLIKQTEAAMGRTSSTMFETGNEEQGLSAINERLELLNKALNGLKRREEEMSKDLDEKRRMLSEQTSTQLNITNNLEYRRKSQDLHDLTIELGEIQKQLNETEAMKKCFETQRMYDKQLADLRKEITVLETSHAHYAEDAAKLEKQLRAMPVMERNYKICQSRLKTTQLARADLVKFHSALDKALMKYHAARMAEVNHSIREKWQEIYKGGDIDYIEIKSDADQDDAVDVERTRARSYNYRVVMFRNDIEMDMRGRCSAGQKGLACLVIRLALAETFCVRCGMVALDEPTTNLDRANVESFALALNHLINTLRMQSNFQLIVITHDEDFVRQLAQGNATEFYWRVGKDERGQSQIHRCQLRQLL